jgi:hypothetical protein
VRRFVILATVLTAVFVSAPVAASDNANNWHIHDDGTEAGHAPIGFFPRILGVTREQYLLDPAACPNATDKVLLGPDGVNGNQVVRSGVCMTSRVVIQLRTQDALRPAPVGWTLGSTAGGLSTYVKLTALP